MFSGSNLIVIPVSFYCPLSIISTTQSVVYCSEHLLKLCVTCHTARQFHSHEGDFSDTENGYRKRSRVSSNDDLSDVKQLLKKLIKKVDSNDRVLKEMQKNQETSSNTYVCVSYNCVFIQQSPLPFLSHLLAVYITI